jgi:hypothetical protein
MNGIRVLPDRSRYRQELEPLQHAFHSLLDALRLADKPGRRSPVSRSRSQPSLEVITTWSRKGAIVSPRMRSL